MDIGFQEIDFPIKIKRIDFNINQKFDIILKELKSLRQNRQVLIDSQLLEIEKIVQTLKETVNEKLNNNFSLIEKLKKKIENNEKLLENNKNEIQNLKDEIINIKDTDKISSSNRSEKHKKKESKESKDNKEDKKINEIKVKNINNENKKEENITSEFTESYIIKKLEKAEKEQFVYSIIIDGAQKTGKTSIIEKFIGIDNFNKNENKNLGCQNNCKYIDIDNTIIKLDIIDFTIGDISKRSITNYKNANAIIFVYSLDNYVSFEKVEDKLSLIKPKSQHIIFLVGNKGDIENREVDEAEARKLKQKYNISFFIEVSAKTGNNIDKMFFEAVKILYRNRKQAHKNSKVIGLSKSFKGKEGSNAINFLFPG